MTQPTHRSSLCTAGLLLAGLFSAAGCSTPEASAGPLPEEPTVKVTLAKVENQATPHYYVLTGTLRGSRQARVAADTAGKVIATFAERGDFVAVGKPIVRLDGSSAALSQAEARALYESARVEEAQAKADCDRADRLFADRAISRAEHEKLRTSCSSRGFATSAAAMRERLAGKSLSDATVRAPFAGVVDERFVTLGEFVQPGASVASIVELDPLRLELSVPESVVGAIAVGQKVQFEVAAFSNTRFEGTIRHVGAALQLPGRSLVVEAVVPNEDRKLRPGMFAKARVMLGSDPRPSVPNEALIGSGKNQRLFVAKKKRLEERVVLVGEALGSRTAILAGVAAGEWVALSPGDEARDGARIQ